jgi:hypothetical protein
MAFDYDTNPTGVFFRAGKLLKYINSRLARATTDLPAELKAIADPFESADYTSIISGIFADYDSMQASVTNERTRLASWIDATLTDVPTVLRQITVANVLDGQIGTVVPALHRQMIADAKTVNRSTVTIGATTALASNQGNGTILTTKLLDGYNPPVQGASTILEYAGLDSELAVPSETMLLECVADSARDGLTEGSERFSWTGGIAGQKLDFATEGSGTGPSLTAGGNSTLVSGGNFETWSSNVPSGWTVDAGTSGVNVLQDTTAAKVYRGSSSAKLVGDGATVTITLGQAVSGMSSRRLYCVSFRALASAAAGTGTLVAKFTGTGYVASATEQVSVLAGAMPVAYTLYNFWIVTPAVIPSDWRLTVSNGGTPGAGSNVWIDSLSVQEGTYHGGIAAAVVPGSSRFVAGDRLTFTVANNAAGVFQEGFRKMYKVQLPSSGAPTIADALAT